MNEGNHARVGKITRRIVGPAGSNPEWTDPLVNRDQRRPAHEAAAILRRERAAAGRERLTLSGLGILIVYALAVVGWVTVIWLGAALFNRAFGAETWLTVSAASWHTARATESGSDLNGVNPGIGIEQAVEEGLRWAAGVYRNSYRRPSAYLAAAWLPLRVAGVRVGVSAGAVSGYPYYGGGFGPFAAALVAVEGPRFGANLVLLPPAGEKSHGAVALQLKWRLS